MAAVALADACVTEWRFLTRLFGCLLFFELHSLMPVLLNGGGERTSRERRESVALADACVTEWRAAIYNVDIPYIHVALADACVTEWRREKQLMYGQRMECCTR